jgi:hypothetical protein
MREQNHTILIEMVKLGEKVFCLFFSTFYKNNNFRLSCLSLLRNKAKGLLPFSSLNFLLLNSREAHILDAAEANELALHVHDGRQANDGPVHAVTGHTRNFLELAVQSPPRIHHAFRHRCQKTLPLPHIDFPSSPSVRQMLYLMLLPARLLYFTTAHRKTKSPKTSSSRKTIRATEAMLLKKETSAHK